MVILGRYSPIETFAASSPLSIKTEGKVRWELRIENGELRMADLLFSSLYSPFPVPSSPFPVLNSTFYILNLTIAHAAVETAAPTRTSPVKMSIMGRCANYTKITDS